MNEWTVQMANELSNHVLGQYVAGRKLGVVMHDDKEVLELVGEFLNFNYGMEAEIIENKLIVKFPEFKLREIDIDD